MLQIVLFLIAIGIALFLWQAFPAFKWVVAVIIAVPLIWLIAEIANDKIHQMNMAKQEEKERASIELENQQAEKKKADSFVQFDSLAKNLKNDMVGNQNIYMSNKTDGVIVLTNDLCIMGNKSYKNIQASFLVLPDGRKIDSCWAYRQKTNEAVLITHMDSESYESEIGFNYFKLVIWDAEKQKFVDKE